MELSQFDYHLPPELIAQHPLEKRDASRMLVVDKTAGTWRDHEFAELPTFLRKADVLVTNNSRVFPARLIGEREGTGGTIELFLVRQTGPDQWETLARPARRLQKGARLRFGKGELIATVVDALDEGHRIVEFQCEEPFDEVIDRLGETPLPPYIHRDSRPTAGDAERYQTVYASQRGAIAAPTAGLHFTPEMIQRIAERGVSVAEVTLHVGYGTFEPVRVSDLSEHQVAEETFEVSRETSETINACTSRGGRLVAVGTTTTRALETAAETDGILRAVSGTTSLTITPGYTFKAVDALLTNFHLPQSSLLVLTATFAGRELLLDAYRHAISSRYRFYSYGDCMLII